MKFFNAEHLQVRLDHPYKHILNTYVDVAINEAAGDGLLRLGVVAKYHREMPWG